jgi:hypothetical protein
MFRLFLQTFNVPMPLKNVLQTISALKLKLFHKKIYDDKKYRKLILKIIERFGIIHQKNFYLLDKLWNLKETRMICFWN